MLRRAVLAITVALAVATVGVQCYWAWAEPANPLAFQFAASVMAPLAYGVAAICIYFGFACQGKKSDIKILSSVLIAAGVRLTTSLILRTHLSFAPWLRTVGALTDGLVMIQFGRLVLHAMLQDHGGVVTRRTTNVHGEIIKNRRMTPVLRMMAGLAGTAIVACLLGGRAMLGAAGVVGLLVVAAIIALAFLTRLVVISSSQGRES